MPGALVRNLCSQSGGSGGRPQAHPPGVCFTIVFWVRKFANVFPSRFSFQVVTQGSLIHWRMGGWLASSMAELLFLQIVLPSVLQQQPRQGVLAAWEGLPCSSSRINSCRWGVWHQLETRFACHSVQRFHQPEAHSQLSIK